MKQFIIVLLLTCNYHVSAQEIVGSMTGRQVRVEIIQSADGLFSKSYSIATGKLLRADTLEIKSPVLLHIDFTKSILELMENGKQYFDTITLSTREEYCRYLILSDGTLKKNTNIIP